jgi:hypothetical protein
MSEAEMPLIAARAGELMDINKLRAHISLLLRIENIGALFGSGTSVTAGGKTMTDVWSEFRSKHLESYNFLKSMKILQEDDKGKALGNFEAVASKIDIALEYLEKIEIDPLKAGNFKKAKIDLQKCILNAVKLNDLFWSGDFEFSRFLDETTIDDYKKFLIRFCANRQPGQPVPWIFTLNYDLGVEWAGETLGINVNNGFKGVHFRKFDAAGFDLGQRNTLSQGQAQYSVHGINYVKLHGSLSWKTDGQSNLIEVPCQTSKVDIDKFLNSESNVFPFQLILPNSAKFSETVGYVYGEMIRRFHEYVSKEQVALIVTGYSFADDHINRILSSALENPTLQLVAFYPSFDGKVHSLESSKILKLAFENQLSNVTIIGGGADAYFDKVADFLPIPAIYDERRAELRAMMRALGSDSAAPIPAVAALPFPPLDGGNSDDEFEL